MALFKNIIAYSDLSNVINYFGINPQLGVVDNLYFRKWAPEKAKLLYKEVYKIPKKEEIYAICNIRNTEIGETKDICIFSPNPLILDYDEIVGFSMPKSIINLDMNNLDTSGMKNMATLFYNSNLRNISFGNIKTSKIHSISSAFQHCEYLKSIDFSNLDLHNIENIAWAFSGCENLEYLHLGNIPIDKLPDSGIIGAFDGCYKLKLNQIQAFQPREVINTFYERVLNLRFNDRIIC